MKRKCPLFERLCQPFFRKKLMHYCLVYPKGSPWSRDCWLILGKTKQKSFKYLISELNYFKIFVSKRRVWNILYRWHIMEWVLYIYLILTIFQRNWVKMRLFLLSVQVFFKKLLLIYSFNDDVSQMKIIGDRVATFMFYVRTFGLHKNTESWSNIYIYLMFF